MGEKKTIREWEIIKGIEILDADGFDRTDEKLYERLFTEKEFDKASIYCTIRQRRGENECMGQTRRRDKQ